MRHYYRALVLLMGSLSSLTFAAPPVLSEADRLFDFAQGVEPTLFFPPAQTQQASGEGVDWFYRYYSRSDTFIAISINGSGPFSEGNVYVAGGQFGASPVLVDTLENLLVAVDAAAPIAVGAENRISNQGNGICTDRKFAAQNDFVRFRITTYIDGVASISERTEFYEEVADNRTLTVIEQTTSIDGIQTATSNRMTSYFESINGLFFESESSSALTMVPAGSASVSKNVITSYAPSLFIGPADSLCVGQEWYAAPVTLTTTDDTELPGNETEVSKTPPTVGTVDSIGEVVTVTGGTFSTVKMTWLYPDSRTTAWFDISFGVKVKSETYQGNAASPSIVEELTQFDLPF